MHMRALLSFFTCTIVLAGSLSAADDKDKDAAGKAPTRVQEALNYVLETDGSYRLHMHSAILVQNRIGLAAAPIRNVSFLSETQNIVSITAYTQKADGRKIPVEESAIFAHDAPPPAGQPFQEFSDKKQESIFFPQVSVGDSMVYDIDIKGISKPGREFAYYSPLSHNVVRDTFDITLSAPKSRPLSISTNEITLTQHEEGDRIIYVLHYSNLKPHKDPARYLEDDSQQPYAAITEFRSYDELAATRARQINDKSTVTPAIKAKADEITAGITNRRMMAAALHDWVAQNILYLAEEIGEDGHIPHAAEMVLTRGYGDCKDHATLYASLLKAKGIEAQNVMINTKAIYQLPKTPIGNFNHEISYLPEFNIYTDTTASTYPFGVLPINEYGKPVMHLVAKGKALRQTPVLSDKDSSYTAAVTAKLQNNGVMVVDSRTTTTGPLTETLYRLKMVEGATEAMQAFGDSHLEVRTLHVTPADTHPSAITLAPSATMDVQYQYKSTPSDMDEKMPFTFYPESLVTTRFLGPIADAKNKTFDQVACLGGRAVEDYTLELPAGYKPTIPHDTQLNNDHIHFASHWSLEGNKVHLHREYSAHFDKPLCAGALRVEVAGAIEQIRKDYNAKIKIPYQKPAVRTETKSAVKQSDTKKETAAVPPDDTTPDGTLQD